MPSKYHIRSFVKDGYYHVFNRGYDKNDICRDEEDFRMFYHLLKSAVTQPEPDAMLYRKNFFGLIKIISLSLMPNHYHIALQQTQERALPHFMQSLISAYTIYYKKKYQHDGSLFGKKYKAILVPSDEYLLHLTRYIHLNPRDIGADPLTYPYSSIHAYIHEQQPWIETKIIFDILSRYTAADEPPDYLHFFQNAKNKIRPPEGSDL